jgi:hypothetical protein
MSAISFNEWRRPTPNHFLKTLLWNIDLPPLLKWKAKQQHEFAFLMPRRQLRYAA